jgi:hypothetical protein
MEAKTWIYIINFFKRTIVSWIIELSGIWVCAKVSEERRASILSPEDGGIMFLRNAGTQPQCYSTQQLIRPSPPIFTSLWEYHVL